MNALRSLRRLREPFYLTTLIAAALVAGGFVILVGSWRGVARLTAVSLQLPYALSGGLGGIALIGVGAAILGIQIARYQRAEERREMEELLDAAADLLALVRRPKR